MLNLFSKDEHQGLTISLIGFYGLQYCQLRAPLASLDFLEMARSFKVIQHVITNFEMGAGGHLWTK
ncbi:hypothetical protein [Candidatus Coxiella mudrowiae]|uniref:hypothetical protein n=1 Tax=Candidatus Coxiella mudrowiae TaxID=2054173 RepID=UPI00066280A9|nr:hypothetical protein [Candidatus Coxiella mudrowiae]